MKTARARKKPKKRPKRPVSGKKPRKAGRKRGRKTASKARKKKAKKLPRKARKGKKPKPRRRRPRDPAKAVDDALKKAGPRMARELKKLIAARSENPPGNEEEAAAVVAKFFKHHKIHYRTIKPIPNRVNIIGQIGSGAPSMALVAHLDTVPAGNGWLTNPFKPVEKEGNVYGRGAQDNKGAMAALMVLVAELKKHEKNLKGTLYIVGAADEERGSKHGMAYLLKKNHLQADYALVPDIGQGMRSMSIGEKGLLFVEVHAQGKQAHGSQPELGVNAIWAMHAYLTQLQNWRIGGTHPFFTRGTMNLGQFRGGHAPNMVPADATVTLDIRYPPTSSKQEILDTLRRTMRYTKQLMPGVRISLKILQDSPAFVVPSDGVLAAAVRRNAEIVLGEAPKPVGLNGTTVAKNLALSGVEAIGFGLGEDVAHQADEYIAVQQMVDFSRISSRVVFDLLAK